MTVINVLKTDDAAILLTDSKLTALGKGSLGNVSKVHPVPHLNAIIATRGPWKALDLVTRLAVPAAKSFADLRRIFAEDFRGACTGALLRGEGLADDFDVIAVGWDNGPQAFMLFNHDKHGLPAWKVHDIEKALVTPVVDDETFQRLGEEEPVYAMNAIVAKQARENEAVGGMVTLTVVDKAGIHMVPFGLVNEDERDKPAQAA